MKTRILLILLTMLLCGFANAQEAFTSVEQLMNRKREAEADLQRKAEAQQNAGCKIIDSSADTLLAAWHSSKDMIITKKMHEDGPAKGKFISYKYYPDKGAIACNDGNVVAKIVEDGLEILDRDMKVTIDRGGLSINGEPCGVVTRDDITIYDRRLGYFSCEATRELVAFFFLHDYLNLADLQKMKVAREEQRKREAEAQAAFKANMMLVTAGNFTSTTGTIIGKIDANGNVFNKAGQRIGQVSSSGKVIDFNGNAGSFNAKGMVYDKTGSPIGHIQPNGPVENANGSRIGHIYNDGRFGDSSGSTVAKFSGNGKYVAAVCYYFFFRSIR